MVRYSPYMLLQKKGPDGVMWRETDYHKQKELEKRNPIFRRGGGTMNWPITDFLFNLIILSCPGILVIIWAIIIGMIYTFLEK